MARLIASLTVVSLLALGACNKPAAEPAATDTTAVDTMATAPATDPMAAPGTDPMAAPADPATAAADPAATDPAATPGATSPGNSNNDKSAM